MSLTREQAKTKQCPFLRHNFAKEFEHIINPNNALSAILNCLAENCPRWRDLPCENINENCDLKNCNTCPKRNGYCG